MFVSCMVSRIKAWPVSRIFLLTLVVTQIGCALMVSIMSIAFHNAVRPDFMITGAVTGLSVSLVVGWVLSHLIHELRLLAGSDALTGLPNRTLSSERVQQCLALARRRNSKVALMFIDLDKFKPVNDTHGHAAGDEILLQVSRRISRCLRTSDVVGRIGGDEFLVLLADVENEHAALTIAEKIRNTLSQPFEVGEKKLRVSSSTGLAIFPDHGSTDIELARHADLAMYRAKKSGSNEVQMFRPDMLAGETGYTVLPAAAQLQDI